MMAVSFDSVIGQLRANPPTGLTDQLELPLSQLTALANLSRLEATNGGKQWYLASVTVCNTRLR